MFSALMIGCSLLLMCSLAIQEGAVDNVNQVVQYVYIHLDMGYTEMMAYGGTQGTVCFYP